MYTITISFDGSSNTISSNAFLLCISAVYFGLVIVFELKGEYLESRNRIRWLFVVLVRRKDAL